MKLNEKIIVTSRNHKQFIIRRLLITDRVVLQNFGNSLSEKSTASFFPHSYDDKTVEAILSRSEIGKDLTLGLFNKDEMAAYFFLWYFDEPIPLLGIGILDTFQGQGLSKKIIQILINAACKKGCDGIELTTLPDNHIAFSLYESMGFRHYADVENVAGDGRVLMEHAMFLQFNPNVAPSTDLHKPPVDFTT
ncbi:GNAT family N-acetyltransferase [Mariniphaga sediminis]|uniref:GNAT family N-acetyltransferase n=1 Tax=Mariniphaga sediminis TaxID=1628158 RepID=A0A399D9E5_9BACT|nr:GNAT family N-acetyltransferase [Mariniphaga sediminis]RIH66971.1 GNAT family N-acetyltransferase [Mariniphaga sediminis]